MLGNQPAPTSTQPEVESTKRLLSKSITVLVTLKSNFEQIILYILLYVTLVHLSCLIFTPSLIEDNPHYDTWVAPPGTKIGRMIFASTMLSEMMGRWVILREILWGMTSPSSTGPTRSQTGFAHLPVLACLLCSGWILLGSPAQLIVTYFGDRDLPLKHTFTSVQSLRQ